MMPNIDKTTWVDKSAVIIGNVIIGKKCGVFPNAVIRGDENSITISDGSNIQDCAVIHVDETHPVKIGKNVSIGHCAMVHGCNIDDDVIVGINATVLDEAEIGSGSIIGANALVTGGTKIPKNSLFLGVPGKVVKNDEKYRKKAIRNAEIYKKISREYIENKYQYYKP